VGGALEGTWLATPEMLQRLTVIALAAGYATGI